MISSPSGETAKESRPIGISVPITPVGSGSYRRAASFRLTLNTIWLLLTPVILLVVFNLQTITPNDFWWHLRTGQIIVDTQTLPNTDLFTFSRSGIPWTNQSWLTEVIFYLLYRAGGAPLIVFWYALTMTTGYAFLELACLRACSGRVRAAALATATAAILGLATWTIRPQAVSFALFGIVLFILEKHRRDGGRIVWCLPPLFALWTNLHGGFVFGLGLLAIDGLARAGSEWAERRALTAETRRLLLAGGASILALALNPSGLFGIVSYVLGFFSSSATQNLNMEFLPLSTRQGDGLLFAGFVILFLVILYVSQRRLALHHVATLLIFGAFALHSRRVLPWFGMAAAPAFAWVIAAQPTQVKALTRRDNRVFNALLASLMVISVIGSLPWLRQNMSLIPATQRTFMTAKSTPTEAVTNLCQLGRNTRVFTDLTYASYLTWACPSVPFFMDTRFELYPKEMWDDYLLISFGQFGWQRTLSKYGANAILANQRTQKTLIEAVRVSPDWHIVYEDENALLATN